MRVAYYCLFSLVCRRVLEKLNLLKTVKGKHGFPANYFERNTRGNIRCEVSQILNIIKHTIQSSQ